MCNSELDYCYSPILSKGLAKATSAAVHLQEKIINFHTYLTDSAFRSLKIKRSQQKALQRSNANMKIWVTNSTWY